MKDKYAIVKNYGYILLLAFVVVSVIVMIFSMDFSTANVNTTERFEFNKTIAYVITSTIAFSLLIAYCVLVDNKEILFIFLFTAVFIVNIGYAFGSASSTLEEALLANKISYMGSVFLPLLMLIAIMDECRYKRNKFFLAVVMLISGGIFFLTMTPGYTPWYYESVDIIFVNGGAKLVKTYGPLHKLYFVYLILYFSLMIAAILLAIAKRKHSSQSIPFILLFLVFGNILVWFIEQKIYFNFEFLAISYLLTEACLLTLYNSRQYLPVPFAAENIVPVADTVTPVIHTLDCDDYNSGVIPDMQDIIDAWPAVAQLTSRETEVFKELLINKKRKDIADKLCVSENTVKKHTTNIFTKLEVSSRADIMNMLLKIK